MGKYILYSHAGSENHGCEALLRTSIITIKDIEYVYTGDVLADKKYGLDSFVQLRKDKDEGFDSVFSKLVYYIAYHLNKDDKIYFKNLYREFIRSINKSKVYISIGGDNYCYHYSAWLEVLNEAINKAGAKSVLWGCSINPDELKSDSLVDDLKRYALITARESETYSLLKNKMPDSNIRFVPDTAFLLPTEKKPLPAGFEKGKTIGLNVSPVATQNAVSSDKLIDYIVEMVDYIIDHTDYQIALIPHVVIQGNDDRVILKKIQDKCRNKSRTVLIEDDNCMVIKGYISECEMFIGARTHATIAAYSNCVPTLVLGYSVKARGIAKDLFGTDENFVLPVQRIDSSRELIEGFEWLDSNKNQIREKLAKFLPEYKDKIQEGIEYLECI